MKIVLGMIVTLILTSCASHQEKLSEYMNLSERALCISYYEILISGRNHPAKLEAIEKRNIDCQPYKEEGLLKGQARNEYYDDLKENLDNLESDKKTIRCTSQKIGNVVTTTCN